MRGARRCPVDAAATSPSFAMIPIGDRLRRRTFPYVNVSIIALAFLVWFYELTLQSIGSSFALSELDGFFFEWAAIPACLSDRFGFDPSTPPPVLRAVCDENRVLFSPFSAMFIHGGWLHILGNMLFLWIFGDNVEDRFGHVRYLLFYLASGLAATATHVAFSFDDTVPSLGASGAIAGVMGAYIVMFPRASVAVIIPWFWFLGASYVPAVFLIGLWFLMQLFSGLVTMGQAQGVAWWAHVGGFAFGVALTWLSGLVSVAQRPARAPPPHRSRGDWFDER